jgi:hypothetical protein
MKFVDSRQACALLVSLLVLGIVKIGIDSLLDDDSSQAQVDSNAKRDLVTEGTEAPPVPVIINDELNENDIKIFTAEALNERYEAFHMNKPSPGKYKTSSNKLSRKKMLDSDSFFLILEYTLVNNRTKYCQMDVDRTLANEKSGTFSRILMEKSPVSARFSLLDKCFYKNCLFTCDKRLARRADALLFHAQDLARELAPVLNSRYRQDDVMKLLMNDFVHSKRDPNQMWVYWNDQARHVYSIVDKFRFNYVFGYNSMAEVSFGAFGTFLRREKRLEDKEFDKWVTSEFNMRKSGKLYLKHFYSDL